MGLPFAPRNAFLGPKKYQSVYFLLDSNTIWVMLNFVHKEAMRFPIAHSNETHVQNISKKVDKQQL